MAMDALSSWRETPTKTSIVEFVAAVTDSGSDDVRAGGGPRRGVRQRRHALDRECRSTRSWRSRSIAPPSSASRHPRRADRPAARPRCSNSSKLTHGSITTDEFDAVCRDVDRDGSAPTLRSLVRGDGVPADDRAARPVGRNGFACWIFSGGGADFMRPWAPEVFGLPPHRVIGSTGSITFRIGDTGPELVKGTDLAVLDDGPQKPISIHQSVGQRPIFAAGNTDGDLPMLQWTAANPHRTLQLVVHHTDADREYAYDTRPGARCRHRPISSPPPPTATGRSSTWPPTGRPSTRKNPDTAEDRLKVHAARRAPAPITHALAPRLRRTRGAAGYYDEVSSARLQRASPAVRGTEERIEDAVADIAARDHAGFGRAGSGRWRSPRRETLRC